MKKEKRKVIVLEEYTPVLVHRDEISDEAGESLWRNYKSQLNVDFPSPKTDWHWQLTAQGWVGYILS